MCATVHVTMQKHVQMYVCILSELATSDMYVNMYMNINSLDDNIRTT